MVHQQKLIILLSCLICRSIEAFMQSPLQQQQQQGGAVKSASTTSKLNGYIAADADEEQVDMSLGGVGLAHESALVMVGNVDRKGSPIATDLLRYTDVTSLDEKQLGEHSISVLCKGEGTEVYQDPGTGTDSTIILAPYEAIAEALTSIDLSVVGKDAKKIVINYCGGEDLLVHEVFGSLQSLLSSLDLPKNQSVQFRSLCHQSFAPEKCGVAVLSIAGGSDFTDNVYWHAGQWYTLLEENLNTTDA